MKQLDQHMFDREVREGRRDFSKLFLDNINCESSELNNFVFRNSRLHNVNFRFATLDRADFSAAKLVNVDFQHASLDGALFERTELINCQINGAKFNDARFDNAQISMPNGLFQNNRALRASFINANLEGLIFTNNCYFEEAKFDNAICKKVSFNTAYLENASFKNTDLTGATFHFAHLKNANFTNAKLEGADFTDAKGVDTIIGKQNIETQQVIKTASSLSDIFAQQVYVYKKLHDDFHSTYLFLLFVILTFLGFAILNLNGEGLSFYSGLLKIIIFALPMAWMARHFNKMSNVYMQLQEYYLHKTLVAEAIGGFRDALKDNQDKIVMMGFEAFALRDPSDKLSETSDGHELVPSLAILEQLKK